MAYRDNESHSLLELDSFELHSGVLPNDVKQSSSNSPTACSIITVLLCIACVALNWMISNTHSTYQNARDSLDVRSVSRKQYNSLRRPSPFLGFESVQRASSPVPRMLINYPIVIALVNSSQTDQVFSNDPQQYMTKTGTVSPEGRSVMLSNEVSVIVQFRAMDYQMERCELHIKMNGADTEKLPSSQTIGIYRLASDKPLDTNTLSYLNKPTRITTVDKFSIVAASPVDWRHEFHCVWDSISSFEVAYLNQGMEEFDDGQDFIIQW